MAERRAWSLIFLSELHLGQGGGGVFSRALTRASDPMCNIIRAWLLGPGGPEVRDLRVGLQSGAPLPEPRDCPRPPTTGWVGRERRPFVLGNLHGFILTTKCSSEATLISPCDVTLASLGCDLLLWAGRKQRERDGQSWFTSLSGQARNMMGVRLCSAVGRCPRCFK